MHIYIYVHVCYTTIYIYTCKYIYILIHLLIYIYYLHICTHLSWHMPSTNSKGWRFGFVIDGSDKIWRPLAGDGLFMVRWWLTLWFFSSGKHVEKPKAISQGDFRIDTDAWYLAWFSSRRVLFFQLTSAPTFCGFYCASQVKVHLSPSNKLFTFEVVCCKTVAPWRFSGRFFSWSFCDIWKDDERCSIKSGWSVQAWQEANCTGFYLYFPISAANFGFVAFISD